MNSFTLGVGPGCANLDQDRFRIAPPAKAESQLFISGDWDIGAMRAGNAMFLE